MRRLPPIWPPLRPYIAAITRETFWETLVRGSAPARISASFVTRLAFCTSSNFLRVPLGISSVWHEYESASICLKFKLTHYPSFTRRDGCKESEFRRSLLLLRYPRPIERGRRREYVVSRRPFWQTTSCATCLAYVFWLVYRHRFLLHGSATAIPRVVARITYSCGTGFSAVAFAEFLAHPSSLNRLVPGRVDYASP